MPSGGTTVSQNLAVDYSFSRPAAAAIKSAGYTAVGRYLGGSAGKQLTKSEAAALHSAGLGIWLVYESTANRALAGKVAGAADAKAAAADAAALGYPVGCPIFFAVDFDAAPAQVAAYFDGVRSVLGDRAGVYGGYKITTAGLAPWRWQTAAWSGGKLDQAAHLYQRVRMTHPISGCDENVICKALPVWLPATATNPATVPASKPAPKAPNLALAIQDITAGRAHLAKVIANHKPGSKIGKAARKALAHTDAALKAARSAQ
jgi:hypothetical protein